MAASIIRDICIRRSRTRISIRRVVKENTDSDGTFAAYYGHLNPTAVLAGRQMFYGGDLWMGSHGYSAVASERKEILEDLYSASSTDERDGSPRKTV